MFSKINYFSVEKKIKQQVYEMKLFSLFVLYKSDAGQAKILKSATELTSFGYFQRGSVNEFMQFTSKIIAERTPTGTRSSVKEQEYLAHVFVRSDNLCGVLMSDQEYPNRVAHTLLNKVRFLFIFTEQNPFNFIFFYSGFR